MNFGFLVAGFQDRLGLAVWTKEDSDLTFVLFL